MDWLIIVIAAVGIWIVRAINAQTAVTAQIEIDRREDVEGERRAEVNVMRWQRLQSLWPEPVPLINKVSTCDVCNRLGVAYDFGGPTCLDCLEKVVPIAMAKLDERRHD
jgi:hypothetical protein